MQTISVFWFRRDLRLEDNRGLQEALRGPFPVLPIFIFDENIIAELEADDPRITFIHRTLLSLSRAIKESSGGLLCQKGIPLEVWKTLPEQFNIAAVYANEDYEPYALERDREIESLLASRGIPFHLFKDQVIFAKNDVLKKDNTPYTVFTPYKNKWISKLQEYPIGFVKAPLPDHFAGLSFPFPSLEELGFKRSVIKVPEYDLDNLDNYQKVRDYPALDGTSHLSVHLRFGTVSIRRIVSQVAGNEPFLNELIWREFFMQVLYHYPDVVGSNFRKKFDALDWINDPQDFEKWQQGQTGFPLVDAGMRELNATGYMHNRVRMIVAGFLCKDLLVDWRWGEAYFAQKLLDFDLAANNGNWQWVAGTGCDAAPYYRVFNPLTQQQKFDPDLKYVKKWNPNYLNIPEIVEHKTARNRYLEIMKNSLTS